MKPTRVVAKVVIITADNKILILRRSETDNRRPLQWDLPGGAVDEGEDFKAAACRETDEEVGINITPHDIHLSFTHAAETEKGNVCWLYFVCQIEKEVKVMLSNEHDDYRWVTVDDALQMILYERQMAALTHLKQYVLA